MLNRFKLLALAAALALGVLAVAPAAVAQSVNPTASAVNEEQLLNALKGQGGPGEVAAVHGRISIPDARAANLIQPAGRDWRDFHENTLPRIAGFAILGILVLLTVFYLIRGRIPIEGGPSNRTITRFGGFERFVHWLTASCFVVLALSGLNVTFGKYLILPVVGPEAFHVISEFAKVAHNYLAFPFTLGVILMLLIWIKDNIPMPRDITWMLQGGGIIGKGHPEAGRFNGGQKLIFWIVVLGGGLIAASGFVLLFPFTVTDVAGMQTAQMIHGALAAIVIAIMIAHIYIGSVGMEGAFDAMGTGEVDLNWAKAHHSLWVEEEMQRDPTLVHPVRSAPAE
jgi:formate dehydrogenase subunit gamma